LPIFYVVHEEDIRDIVGKVFNKVLIFFICISIICSIVPNKDTLDKITVIKIAKETPLVRIAIKTMNWLESKADDMMGEKGELKR
jgi:hypothetical protein